MPVEKQLKSQITFWKLIVVSVCLCVFLFATHAKLAQYDAVNPTVTPVTSAKLWVGEHRSHVPAPVDVAPVVLFVLFAWTLSRQVRHDAAVLLVVSPPILRLQSWNSRRFFRPPPAR